MKQALESAYKMVATVYIGSADNERIKKRVGQKSVIVRIRFRRPTSAQLSRAVKLMKLA